MQRILTRAARRCTISSVAFKFPHAQVNAASGFHSAEASTCSNDYGNVTWRTGLAGSMQSDVVNALRRGDRQQASLILSNLKHSNQALTKKDFSYILEYCSNTPDPLFAMETLELMEAKGIGMSKNIYVSVIQALSRGGYRKEALHWLTLFGEKESTHGTLPLFNIFLNACGGNTELNDVECCLEKMESHLLGKSEVTYSELLKLPVLQRNLSAVHDIWKECTREYSVDVQPELLQEETESLENVHMDAYVSSGHNFADNVELQSRNAAKTSKFAVKKVLRWSFNDIMHACVRPRKFQLAEQLFVEMRKLGLQPSKYTYDGLVKTVIAGKGIAYAIKVIEAMERRGLEPYNDTLALLSVGCSKTLQLGLAEEFLERISYTRLKYIHAFNALLVGCDIMNEPERAVHVLAKMFRMNMKPNCRTYELLFSLFGNVNVPYEKGNVLSKLDVSKRISIIEMDMLSNKIQHSFVSMKNLIRAFGAEGMIEEMLKYLNAAENVLLKMGPNQKSDLYCIVLHALVEAKETHKAIRIFKIMRTYSLPSNLAIYNIMIECCQLLPCLKSSYTLLSLMLRDGFRPTVVTFTSLLKVLLAKEDFVGALDLLDMCKLEGIKPDIEMFNTILSHAYTRDQIHVVEYIVECVHRANIQPDPATLWYTFCAYTEQELYNTAIEALQVLSMALDLAVAGMSLAVALGLFAVVATVLCSAAFIHHSKPAAAS
ncbi:hypothetical protein QOZ80_6AG0538470 [Eleusine coracana subsp. coracana]|nr:hypothetical protein QOZ80_6AG0538470 [Eleusine coracana subsp. coracana]